MIGLQDKIDAIGVAKELKNTEVKAALTDIHERKAWKQVYAKVGSPFGKKQGATVEWNRTIVVPGDRVHPDRNGSLVLQAYYGSESNHYAQIMVRRAGNVVTIGKAVTRSKENHRTLDEFIVELKRLMRMRETTLAKYAAGWMI